MTSSDAPVTNTPAASTPRPGSPRAEAPGTAERPRIAETPRVVVRRSTRRKKTVSAHFSGEDVVLAVPHTATRAQIDRWKTTLVPRVVAKRDAAQHDARRRGRDEMLEELAGELSRRYLGGEARPTEVKWSARQHTRWGSATPATEVIRISRRLATAPPWVLETVVLHELVHLLEAHHNERFWRLANRHPRAHDAARFLDGVAWADSHPSVGEGGSRG